MDDPISFLKQYEEIGKLLNTFYEWRYKVLNRFFIIIATVFIASQWMYTIEVLKRLIFFPLLIGAIFSIFTGLMDIVNSRRITNCYDAGAEIEGKLFSSLGIYGKFKADLSNIQRRKITYRVILKVLYWGTGISLFLGSIYAFIKLF